jgi:hypothetical protein
MNPASNCIGISTTLTDADFLQEPLDLKELDPVDFERLIFYLLDEMGFTNISWRKGGEGNTATDGGRDLEANYWRIDSSGSREENYWFEVKHRSQQLKKDVVQATVINSCGQVDHLVIVTNTTVSNPCIDWITTLKENPIYPKVTIWQGHDIERILRNNPRTLAQFYSATLNISGKCKVIKSRFKNLLVLPSSDELQKLWEVREQLIELRDEVEDEILLLAIVFAELSLGDITKRPWGIWLDKEARFKTTVVGIDQILSLIRKGVIYNKTQEPLLRGLSYLIQCILLEDGTDIAVAALLEAERFFTDSILLRENLKKKRLVLILKTMLDELAVYCSKDCMKVSYPRDLGNEIIFKPSYFERFKFQEISKTEEKNDGKFSWVLESKVYPCEIGLLEKEENCLLLTDSLELKECSEQELKVILEFVRKVLQKRVVEVSENNAMTEEKRSSHR